MIAVAFLRWVVISLLLANASCAQTSAPLAALWTGNAHFEEVGTLDWTAANGAPLEQAGSFTVHDGVWYVFNRTVLIAKNNQCPQDHAGIVVRSSKDHGKTWSDPVSAVKPGDSRAGDGCAVLDGSVYRDASTGIWHMLAQCLDQQNAGGWAMCHYTRAGMSALGSFVADAANPVVTGGQLWSRICAGESKACPTAVTDEGTPDIVEKRNGLFFVTIHGFDAVSRQGYRGVVSTPDFRHWQVSGNGLPDDAILGPRDCTVWLKACAGAGQATTLLQADYIYMVVETMDQSLGCTPGQKWVFQIVRAKRGSWPKSSSKGWNKLPGDALLKPSYPHAGTACALQYARWINDKSGIYLIYEDWGPNRDFVRRRMLKLMHGRGPKIIIRK